MPLKTVYLSLGSNVGDREEHLRSAVCRLQSSDFRITRVSSVYETEPMYMKEQESFLNLALEAETTLFPMRLLLRTTAVERGMGRKRLVRNGPRIIDIDIIVFGSFVVDTAQLQIPHPRMAERRFVLEPLAELAPDLRHPVTRQTIRELLATAPSQLVRRTKVNIVAPFANYQVRP